MALLSHPNVVRVEEHLRECGFSSSVSILPDSTRTAQEAASALGVTVSQIGKSIVFAVAEKTVVIVLPGDRQVSLKLAEEYFGAPPAKLSGADVKARTGFPIGGVSPFGLPSDVHLVVDRACHEHDSLWVAAGIPHAVCSVKVSEWEAQGSVVFAELSEELCS